MSVRCTLCHKDLPESAFYPSALKRHQHQCKKCSYDMYGKKHNQKYADNIKKLPEREFDVFYGGYTIKILNYVRGTECKYNIISTKGNTFSTNDGNDFIEKIKKIVLTGDKQ